MHQHSHCHCYRAQQSMPQSIDVNVELVKEREALRFQLLQLEEKYQIDIEELKVNLLDESERILTKELTDQAKYFENIIRQKDTQLQQQAQQIQQLEHVNIEVKRENNEIKIKFQRKSEKVKLLKAEQISQKQLYEKRIDDTEAYFRFKYEQEMKNLEKDMLDKHQHEKVQTDEQIRRLKQLCSQFEEKYKQMLKELDQVKHLLQEKQHELDELHSKMRSTDSKYDLLAQRMNRPGANQSPTQPRYQDQNETHIKELKKKDEKIKKLKLRLQEQPTIQTRYVQQPPLIIDRPVDRIVEVIRNVPVIQEKIVQQQPQRQPIIVNYPDSQNNGEDIEDLEDQIQIYKNKITTLQNQLSNLRQEYNYVTEDRDELKQNLDIMISRVKEMEELIRSKNKDLNDKLRNNQGQRPTQEDKITVFVGKDRKDAQVRRS